MTDSNKSVSPLRQRMIDDMTMRKLNPKTQAGYLRAVKNFARFYGQSPDRAEPEDLRRFQLNMVERGVSSTTLNVSGANSYSSQNLAVLIVRLQTNGTDVLSG
ncbi:MAG: phage integrase N-terminal SAM-like domain-containing protein [Proteobacteria bacterium]|nr:phage integrase N-terminal SAM-like domain-containing protein [Pseudomonadota bacterium]